MAKYRPQLDGLRAICILLTLGAHTSVAMPVWVNGSMGVDVFFALSGWLITWLILAEWKARNAFDLQGFFIKRFFRIVPVYFLTIALYGIAVVLLTQMGRGQELQEFRNALPYLISFTSEYRSEAAGTIFGHAWTLGIEEKFYLLWPAALFLFRFRISAAVLSCLLIVVVLVAMQDPPTLLIRGYFGLGFGAAAAILVQRYGMPKAAQGAGVLWLSMGGVTLFYAASILWPIPGLWNVLVSFYATGLVVSLWFNQGSILSRALSFAPLAWVGKLTYSIYLIHVLSLNVAAIALAKLGGHAWWSEYLLAYAISILGAWGIFSLVERPLINLGRRMAARKPATSGANRRPV